MTTPTSSFIVPSTFEGLTLLCESISGFQHPDHPPAYQLMSPDGGQLELTDTGVPLIDGEAVTDALWSLLEDEADEEDMELITDTIDTVVSDIEYVSDMTYMQASLAKAALAVARSLHSVPYPMGEKKETPEYTAWVSKSKLFDVACAILSMQMRYTKLKSGDSPDFWKSPASVTYSSYDY